MDKGNGIKLIVGLGNPGPEYATTRHNAGYWLIEELAELADQPLSLQVKFKGCLTHLTLRGHSLILLQPTTFMNRSGQSVASVARFYKISPEEILIIHDDLDLPPGQARLKFDGGHGGNNGLRDIVAHLGTKAFFRLRLGIGHPGHKDDVVNYVLHPPTAADKTKILKAIAHALDVIPDIVEGYREKAMNQLHTLTK